MSEKNQSHSKETAHSVSKDFVDQLRRNNPQPRNGRKVTDKDYARLERNLERTLLNLTAN